MAADVVAAIAAITRDLPAIGKGESSKDIPYKFRGIETLMTHIAPLMAKHKLVIVPDVRSLTVNRDVENSKGRMAGWTETILHVGWTILGPEGGVVTGATTGIGRDNSDKGANKAQTQAFKYLLMELFSIGDKDDDNDYTGPGVADEAPPPSQWETGGWSSKEDHDQAMANVKSAILGHEEAMPGFRAHIGAIWTQLGLTWPMTFAALSEWAARVDAEALAFQRGPE